MLPIDKAIKEIVKAIEKKRLVYVFPFYARLVHLIDFIAPGLLRNAFMKPFKQLLEKNTL